MSKMNFEVGADGPKLKFNFLTRPEEAGLGQWISEIPRRLKIGDEATLAAENGVPLERSGEPSAIELKIQTAHRAKQGELEYRARNQVAALETQVRCLATDITDGEYAGLISEMSGDISEVEREAASELPRLTKAYVDADTSVKAFHARNRSADISSSNTIVWIATALGTAIGEVIVNSQLFQNDLGLLGGVAAAGSIGVGIAIIGAFAGIFAALMMRPSLMKRVAGAFGLVIAVVVAAFFLLGAAHYRLALQVEARDTSEFIVRNISENPLKPLADFVVIPFMLINVACLVLVAWKSIPMLGFGDLKARRRALEKARDRRKAFLTSASDRCNQIREEFTAEAASIADASKANANTAEAAASTVKSIIKHHEDNLLILSDSMAYCQRKYWAVLKACHPESRIIDGIKIPVLNLQLNALTSDVDFRLLTGALEARSVKLRQAYASVLGDINDRVDEAKANIQTMADEAELNLRGGTAERFHETRFANDGAAA